MSQLERLRPRAVPAAGTAATAFKARSQPGPRCLVQGDAHQSNRFLRSSGRRIWHDWQLVRQGQPWRDRKDSPP